MKKILLILSAVLVVSLFAGCNQADTQPDEHHIKYISELATMDCYYHAVESYDKSKGLLWFGKDAKFFAEGEVIATIGIDTSLIEIEANELHYAITLPPAEVQNVKLNGDVTFYMDKFANDASAEIQHEARAALEKKVENIVSGDKILLNNAQERAKILIEEYITNMGDALGVEYTIEWKYLEPESETTAN